MSPPPKRLSIDVVFSATGSVGLGEFPSKHHTKRGRFVVSVCCMRRPVVLSVSGRWEPSDVFWPLREGWDK